ncbi:growth hormone-releasing hormone receptor isoform X2 [Ahaetulla prasina]|uniref:growth hormone-releasing hormone receptor isoform X2 n=1 Tax=Ahaetulla prasina TaxID=499056 RepID=UPI002649C76A|nr:growth hormone-releasing hormone receptor isoform X2 [Ahaetulla prasina]
MVDMKQEYSCVLLSLLILPSLVRAKVQPDCVPILEWKQNETNCLEEIQMNQNQTADCKRIWDRLLCWPEAKLGESLSFTCPGIIFHFTKQTGMVKRSCTEQGWSDPNPPYSVACSMEDDASKDEVSFFSTIQIIYTVGYSISAVSLAIAIVVLLAVRRLRCPRNYIHVHLFATFILKAIAIFIKDAVLLDGEGNDYCTFSTAGCKISVVFLNFFTMANFMWLLVEALYLNYLLLSSFPQGKKFYWWLVFFGWGSPTFFTALWIFLKVNFEDILCWDVNQDSPYWWVIQGPIMVSVAVNFILFVNIVQILTKKLHLKDMRLNNSFRYRRLSKSTLLLIPLLGTHYIIFNFLPEYTQVGARLYIELCIGSFQGFIVAFLYCFLNQEEEEEDDQMDGPPQLRDQSDKLDI